MRFFKTRNLLLFGILFILIGLTVTALQYISVLFFNEPNPRSFLAPAGEIMKPDVEAFSFAAVSDTGARNSSIDKIIDKVKASDAQFIFYLGDMARHRNVYHFNWMAEELEDALQGFPFFAIPGNHDIDTSQGHVNKSLYRMVYGQTDYWFSYGNTLFIALNSSEYKLEDWQFDWLENILKRIRPLYTNCVLATHIPPQDLRPGCFYCLNPEYAEKLAETIRPHNVNLILSGHVHCYGEGEFAGVKQVVFPSSGQDIRSDEKRYGYVEVKINGSEVPETQLVLIDGNASGRKYVEDYISSELTSNALYPTLATLFFLIGLVLICIAYRREYLNAKK